KRLDDRLWQTRENAPVIVSYDSLDFGDLGWGSGLGQNGILEVLVERIGPRTVLDPLAFIERCVAGQLRGAMATVIRTSSRKIHVGARICVTSEGHVESSGLPPTLHERLVQQCRRASASGITDVHTYQDGGTSVDVLVDAIVPPPRLFLFGAGSDAAPVANL